jgi:hypothetical protein
MDHIDSYKLGSVCRETQEVEGEENLTSIYQPFGSPKPSNNNRNGNEHDGLTFGEYLKGSRLHLVTIAYEALFRVRHCPK